MNKEDMNLLQANKDMIITQAHLEKVKSPLKLAEGQSFMVVRTSLSQSTDQMV